MIYREARIATAFLELSDIHKKDFDPARYVRSLAGHSVLLLDVDAAGVLLIGEDGRFEAIRATVEPAHALQLEQLRIDAGPGIESLRTGAPVNAADLRSDFRWGTFRTSALTAGFAALHALPLHMHGATIGSMTLFRRRAGGLSRDDLALGEALTQVATACLLSRGAIGKAERLSGQLQTALNTRIMIEQAKGILAERRGSTTDNAFELMRSFARHDRILLDDLARAVVDGSPSVASLKNWHAAKKVR
ncbi:MAG: hypothetical protein JWQ81_2635 [Amycolatopsis sp.]|jgi:hypothetical protein|uniref:GAF and ANTAR domain-containing protein n=1 Tax=Amycolatopsis sp. TaxID=37632 RepID=UPI0026285F2D|nr:GAF and ANTAR domain-containing protein [Amycolatopsis sp.]MCU1681896.1 hypothetical protein [Amycolatopsis sp.]